VYKQTEGKVKTYLMTDSSLTKCGSEKAWKSIHSHKVWSKINRLVF